MDNHVQVIWLRERSWKECYLQGQSAQRHLLGRRRVTCSRAITAPTYFETRLTRLSNASHLASHAAMAELLLAGLNPAQRAAVTSQSQILQVLAPPGSGKTKTLTTRVAFLLAHHGYNPQNIICCTFTIKAAKEMRERLRGLVGCEFEANLVLGTFHSICRRYLVAYGPLIGIRKGFGIADTSDTLSIVKKICKKGSYNIEPKTARSRISSHKAKNKRVEELPRSAKNPEHQDFRQIYEEYESSLAMSNLLDYDDLLLRCLDLLQKHPTCASNVEAVLIDEFQDTNVVQFELMKLFASSKQRITIVGDPDQSIYGFRSAEIENLRRMKVCYPETVVINLEENYRSSSAILRLAQDVIEQDESRPNKKLVSTQCYGTLPVLRKLANTYEEASWITSEVKRMVNVTGGVLIHSDIAVLIRSAYLSLLIEKSFTGAGIPYRMVGGMRFFDRAEIRLIVDYLRTISHPDNDSAFLSIINVPSRKIGDASIASFVKLGEEKSLPIWQVVQKVLSGKLKPDKKLSNPSEQDLQKLVNIINDARKKMTTTTPADVPSMLIDFIVSRLYLPAHLQKKYKDDYEDRIENIQEFLTHAKDVAAMSTSEQLPTVDGVEQQQSEGSQESLDQFLANIVLSTEVENNEKGDEKPRVTISTIHSAKGLEWPVVFVPAIYDGSIPHSRAEDADEERRLFYVAMTRAQALLTMTLPLMQSREQEQTNLTRFLPLNLHKRLSERGPIFSDEVVGDIATILRRDMPTQEALTKGLQAVGDNESAEDSLWPTDGSYRHGLVVEARQSQAPHAQNVPVSGTATTMSDFTSFSTAKSYMNSAPSDRAAATTMEKFASFSTARSYTQGISVNVREPSLPHMDATTMGSLPASKKPKTNTIPTMFSAHTLKTSTFKRPRTALEETTVNPRKQYVFFSSSPPPEEKESQQNTIQAVRNSKANTIDIDSEENADLSRPTKVIKQPTIVQTSKPEPFSLLKSQTSTQNRFGIKKTLGVKRMLGGWDSRKNR